jgi:ADP-ribose pyrophosphatase YjhB (NUDIX family)
MAEKLFNEPAAKKVMAYDLFDNVHQRELKNFKFRPSAYGILRQGTKILFKRHPAIEKFDLPGGGIELDETISKGLIREFKEETGLKIKVDKLLSVEDNYFTFEGEDAHGLLIFYEVEKISGELTPNGEDSVDVQYFEIDSLTKENVHRSCWNIIQQIKMQKIA